MESNSVKTALLVMAGGRASRMGGVNKALVPFRGTTLIQNVLACVGWSFDERWVSANRDEERFEALGLRVVRDVRAGFPGPLGGIEALSAEGTRADWILMVPCDTPFLPKNLMSRFMTAVQEDASTGEVRTAYVAHAAGRLQSAVALLSRAALEQATPFLDAGERKLGVWYQCIGARVVRWDDVPEEAFENINTPEDRARWA